MYERRSQKPISRALFVHRLLRQLAWALALLVASLAAGMVGYATLEKLPWVDAFLNAAMLLGGMGPVNAPQTTGGKVFAGAYALYAGLVFIVTAALLFTPILHRIIHHFHWETKP